MFSALKGVKCWVWAKATVLSHLNLIKFFSIWWWSAAGVLCHTFFFSFFWRKQKINVSKSGLYKPNLKLMSISTAEGQMWKQRFILEVWSALVSLALDRGLTLRHARNSLGTSRLKPHLKHLNVLLQCAVHCPTAEACSVSCHHLQS